MPVFLFRFCTPCVLLSVVLTACGTTARGYTFEGETPPWARSVIAEPDGPSSNHVLRIAANQPHHTRVTLPDAVPSAFVAETRIRLQESDGAAPAAYLYAFTADGFIALTIGSDSASLFHWRGSSQPSTGFGRRSAPPLDAGWVRVKLALENGTLAAKVWKEGTREPGWSITAQVPDISIKNMALGVWLPPDKPATASLLFDDVTLRTAVAEDRIAAYAVPALPLQIPAKMQAGVFESGPHIGVVAGDLAVAFNRLNGSLRHLVHLPSGRLFADAQQRRPLFSLHLTRWQSGEEVEISSDDFNHLEWRSIAPGSLQGQFSDSSEPGMVVTATITAGQDGLAHFRIAIKNPSGWAVAMIRYPCFAGSATLGGDAADDRLLFPQSHTDGIVVNAPGTLTRKLQGSYPGSAAVQMAALYDSAAGVLLATQDSEGHCKNFEAEMIKNRFVELKVSHLRPEVPGDSGLPYDTVLGAFTGEWRDAADLYKRWACQQPWCARRLTQRDDVPAFLKEGAAGVIFGIGNAKGYNGAFGPELDSLPAEVEAYRKQAKVPHMIVVPYGWENRGTWAGIHYFPARPSDEAWRRVNDTLRMQGNRTALLTSGYWWVVRRPPTSNGPAFDDSADFEKRSAMLVQRADGTPWLQDNTDKAGTFGDWRGLSAKLCHGSANARQVMLDIFLQAAELGAPLLSFDQEIGGGQSAPCYANGHGHPPGYGTWMWTGFRDLCVDIRAKGRKEQPEISLLVENCGEMIIPVMATYWSRQFGVLDHGSSGEGSVGLFSYLYHEYVTAIGAAMVQGQGPQGARISAGLRCQALAHNLARGLIPCPFSYHVPLEPKDKHAAQVSRAYFAFCEPLGSFPEFLLLGETLHPPLLRCEEREEWFVQQPPASAKKGTEPVKHTTRPLPDVVAGRFKAPDGTTGTILVNATPEPRHAVIINPGTGRPARMCRADKSVEKSYDALPEELAVELEPFGVRMLVVQ
jgi:hypothetical protein